MDHRCERFGRRFEFTRAGGRRGDLSIWLSGHTMAPTDLLIDRGHAETKEEEEEEEEEDRVSGGRERGRPR